MSEGYYFSYSYDLSLSKIKIARLSLPDKRFIWNRIMLRRVYETGVDKIWGISLI
jgi:hypothetical protein